MKIIGIVPARYQSARLPGKPIVDICGKPMIWWVYQEALKVGAFAEVLVATDDERVRRVCDELGMKVLMTSRDGACLIDRLYCRKILPAFSMRSVLFLLLGYCSSSTPYILSTLKPEILTLSPPFLYS